MARITLIVTRLILTKRDNYHNIHKQSSNAMTQSTTSSLDMILLMLCCAKTNRFEYLLPHPQHFDAVHLAPAVHPWHREELRPPRVSMQE